MQYLLGNFHKMINDKHRWEWWQLSRETARLCDKTAGGYYIYLCISSSCVPSGAQLNCPMRLTPSCFIDGSLCLQLTQYQHLASENSLGSISIIQPSCTKGTAERDESIWRHTGGGRIISLWCEWKASRLSVYSVMGGTRWWEVTEHFGGWRIGRQADSVYCGGGEQLHVNMGWGSHLSLSCNNRLKLSS